MTTQHTSGPWKHKEQWGYYKIHSEELLAALEYLLEDHKRMFPDAHPNSTIKWSECEEVKQAKRAIAKAQGK